MQKSHLIIFSKTPVAGTVKTRLIPRYGAVQATLLYQRMLRIMCALAVDTSSHLTICYLGKYSHPFLRKLRRDYAAELTAQTTGDLGQKMLSAFQQHFAQHPRQGAMIVGGDCLGVSSQDIERTQTLLAQGKAVFIPSTDGGYVLIALPNISTLQQVAPIFSRMPWGTSRIWPLTEQRLQTLGINYAALPCRWDVDTPADLKLARRHYHLLSA